jgi:non-homologous end joining protein Ku
LITDNFYETKNFIDEMVKNYNNWEGKDNYAERFMDIIEKKFL